MKKLTLFAIALLASVVSFALNPFAYGLSSSLSDDGVTLTVNYSLNANAKAVNVVVLNGEEVVATIPCDGIAKGDHSVQVSTVELPKSVALTWKVNVEGTSVEVPTQEAQMYNLYCPHGLAIDKNPESENFGRILVAEGMQAVPATNYLSSGKGAGLYVFNPSFASDSVVYKGGNDFTRLWSGQGYQPWRVKISEDGRIFVSSLDLNGVVVWEVSKDLQTWTPVIAGTQDENGNILDAGGNFVAGMNVSMDVVGSGENLKLLLYSCSTKAASFALSAYRLDEYALGTATTFTGTPRNILIGGYAIVHTNAEFIYDGEGGYWFGASRSNTSGTPAKNLAHINANGVEDYTSTDGALYGGDGVLVHNGMLFKGKARTSSTVGNFGVWTIGKDAEGNTTLTEKWTVSANGIGRNLNEFAVDYAENLYVVGNSNEKIIAYALPYSGTVETPAASKYAFQLEAPATPEPVEMVGVVKRALQVGESVVVLTHEADGTPHIYNIVGETITEVSQEGVVATDPENPGDHLAISDIAVTEDGKLVAVNYVRCYNAPAYVESGYKEGTTRFYMWDALTADPTIWFTSQATANSLKSDQGYTMALNGSSTDCQIIITGVHRYGNGARFSTFNMVDGALASTSYFGFQLGLGSGEDELAEFDEAIDGTNFQLSISPRNEKKDFIMDAEKMAPVEWQDPNNTRGNPIVLGELDSTLIGVKYNGVSYVTYEMKTLAVAPYADADGKLAGIKVLDVTEGFEAAEVVKVVDLDAPIAATAAATAVAVKENGLTITLVADATVYTFMVELNLKPTIYTITATANPVEGGNIEGLENEGAYEAGTELTLRAIANEGYEFVKWTMDNTIVGTEVEYTFIVASNVEMVAHFKKDGPVEIIGIVKRALQLGESVVVLTHEADATPHIYNVVGETITEVSQEGVVARDPENAGDYLAISDIASTEDGKLVAVNYMMCQNEATNVDAGYKRGETRFYLWNDIAADPSIWFTSKMTSNWFRSKQGYTIALKGTSQNAEIFTTGVHGQNGRTRFSWFHIIDGVYEEPAVNTNDYYHFHNGPDNIHATGNSLEALVGNQYELNASPLADNLWIMDGNLVEPYEYVLPATNNVVLTEGIAIDTELGKKFNGATYITIDDQVLMVAPYATAEGLLAGVKVLDITAGLASATEIAIANLDAAVEATAAATAVVVDEDELIITLVGDATLYTLTAELTQDPGPGTTIDNVDVEVKASKMIKNGQLIIIKNGIQYNAQGAVVK